jgi:hypothetical protein
MDASDVAFALACAELLNPGLAERARQNGPLTVPEVRQMSEWGLANPQTFDSRGNNVEAGNRAAALYYWSPQGRLELSSDVTPGMLAHEMTHHLQNRADGPARLGDREYIREIERQAYDTQERARFECLRGMGGWDTETLGPLARKLVEGMK